LRPTEPLTFGMFFTGATKCRRSTLSWSIRKKKVRSFSDSNGFVNFFNITGQVAEIDYSNNRIRLLVSRRNPNYFLDIEMENSRIPARYKALELVTIEGYVRGVQGDDNAWGVRFVGRSINPASLVDLDEDALQDYFHRMNGVMGVGSAERATAAGAADAQAESRQHVSEYRRKKSARRSGNYVGLSGFVDNAKLITGPGPAGWYERTRFAENSVAPVGRQIQEHPAGVEWT
jgi:hypothetical protein